MSEQTANFRDQNIIIESRKRISVSGVKDVISFDDETVLLDTELGKLTVKGDSIHITSFNTDSGELSAEGKIHAAVYLGDAKQGGFVTRIFK